MTTNENEKVTVLMCGGKKCCPTLFKRSDGSARLVDDDGSTIALSAEQVEQLRVALNDKENAT